MPVIGIFLPNYFIIKALMSYQFDTNEAYEHMACFLATRKKEVPYNKTKFKQATKWKMQRRGRWQLPWLFTKIHIKQLHKIFQIILLAIKS
jgi:hypothetical protein